MSDNARPRFSSRPLRLLRLEDRAAPAVFAVTHLGDEGPGSLREAITLANDEAANPGPDEIVFAPGIRGGTVNLTTAVNPPTGTIAGPTALVVTSAVTVRGTGETIARGGDLAFRLFQVTEFGRLTLTDLTLTSGLAQGGAGLAGGGAAAGLGGGVYNQGVLRITVWWTPETGPSDRLLSGGFLGGSDR